MPFKNSIERAAYQKKYLSDIWYPKNKDIHNKQVYEYNRKYNIWLTSLKQGLVCPCGESDARCLDFHHRDPNTKLFSIAEARNRRWSKDKVLSEIEKCAILCSNCHRKLHLK